MALRGTLACLALCLLLLVLALHAEADNGHLHKLKECFKKIDKHILKEKEIKVLEHCIPKAFIPPIPQQIPANYLKCALKDSATQQLKEVVHQIVECERRR